MDYKISLFQELADLFNKHGYQLFMVGGSTRDYLLNIPLIDMDLVTDATPEQTKSFLENADYHFAKFGSVKIKVNGIFPSVIFEKELNTISIYTLPLAPKIL